MRPVGHVPVPPAEAPSHLVSDRRRPEVGARDVVGERRGAAGTRPAPAGHRQRRPAAGQPAYREDAHLYDPRTRAFQSFRRAIVEALPLNRGDVVLDVGCGTGLCFSMLREKIGPRGCIVGIDASAEMVAIARDRAAREGWRNVVVMQSSVMDAQIPVTADAALFCAVHDVLQSPAALRNVVDCLRPGAPLAAGGGKWAAPWMVALNLQVRALHAPYVASFEGFDRPWSHLERLVQDFHLRDLAFGSGYVATGRSSHEIAASPRRLPSTGGIAGAGSTGRIAGPDRSPSRSEASSSTDRHALSSMPANSSGAVTHTP